MASVMCARSLLPVVEQAGVEWLEFLRTVGITPDWFEQENAELPCAQLFRMYELALELTGDAALGLRLAESAPWSDFAPLSYLIFHSESLRKGLALLAKFERLVHEADRRFQLSERGDHATLRYSAVASASPRVQRYLAEFSMVGLWRLIRMTSASAAPEEVSFEYAAPAYRGEYTRIFEHKERFERPFTGIVFDRVLLDMPSPYKNEAMLNALQTLAERRLMHLTRSTPYALRVRDFIVQQGWPKRVEMKVVARTLQLSERSLRRQLASEGTSFSAVESEALAIVAKHLLRDRRCTVQETAGQMGFSNTAAFHRAFKRWTGTTPGACRDE